MRIRLRRYICVLCCLLLLLRQTPGHAQEPEPGELYAQAAVLMDADSGRVLYDKNGAQVLAMASTTKIMTCILALELADPQETVEISAYAASMPKVKLYVQKGERYLLEDLLYSLMLESHNDAAVAIAEHLGRKYLPEQLGEKSPSEYSPEESRQAVEAFAAVMNRKAAELGCGDTWFITPNGLDATQVLTLENGETVEKRHSTTARDLASIMCYCIRRSPRSQAFLEITQTPSHSFSIDNGRSFSCANHNAFLQMMQGAISGKTGFTNQAGYCYVGALERDGRTLVVALLACGWPNNKGYKWSDTRILMNFGLNDFAYHSGWNVIWNGSCRRLWKPGNRWAPYNTYSRTRCIGKSISSPPGRCGKSTTDGVSNRLCGIFCCRKIKCEKYYKKMQFVLGELLFLCYTVGEINHGGICFFIRKPRVNSL